MILRRFTPFSHAVFQISLAFFSANWKQAFLVRLDWIGKLFMKRNLFFLWIKNMRNFRNMIASQSYEALPRAPPAFFEKTAGPKKILFIQQRHIVLDHSLNQL